MNSNKWLWMNGFWRQNSYLCPDNFVHNILVLLLGQIMAIYINAVVSTAWWLRKVSKLADLWWTGERTRILNARDHEPHWPVKINLFKSQLHWLPFKQIASASTGSTAKKINHEHSASIDWEQFPFRWHTKSVTDLMVGKVSVVCWYVIIYLLRFKNPCRSQGDCTIQKKSVEKVKYI